MPEYSFFWSSTEYENKENYTFLRLNGKYQGLKTSSKYGIMGRKQG